MIKSVSVALVLLTLFIPWQKAQALSAPTQTSPANNSMVSSTKLQWQPPSYSLYTGVNPYKVQLDDDPNFGSPKDPYYTPNTSYTPSLTQGVWYWKVKAKDSTGIWSDWSSVWQFTYSTTTSSPSPSPTPNPTSSPPSSLSTASSGVSITGVPSSLDVDQQFDVTVNLSNFSASTKLYLKGAFKKAGSPNYNYFGQTLVSGSWTRNSQTYTSQFPITTDYSGNWSGSLTIKGDSQDSGYSGEGDYIFKVGYYQDPSVSWSNETTVHLTGEAQTDSQSASTNNTTSTKTNQTTKTVSTQNTTSTQRQTKPFASLPVDLLGTSSASPSSQSSPTPALTKTAGFTFNNLSVVGVVLVIAGGIIFTLIQKPEIYENILHKLTRRN